MFVNTRAFSPVAIEGITQATVSSYEWHDWWREQNNRCLYGYEVAGVKITGIHYFYLNFWKIRAKVIGTSRKQLIHPRFLDIDFEMFWHWERAKEQGLDMLYLKRRQVGATDKYSVIGGHEYSFFPDSYVQIVCSSDKHATNMFKRVRWGLDSLGGTEFYKARQGSDSDTSSSLKAQFIETIDGRKVVDGYMSQIEKFVSDGDAQALVGAAPSVVIFDEIGLFPGFLSVKEYIVPGMINEGVRTGNCLLVGTGGEANEGIEELTRAFYNPERYDLYAIDRSDYDDEELIGLEDTKKSGRTCMFIPGWKYNIIDDNGNSLREESIKAVMAQRKRLESDEKRYLEYVTQYPLTPEEALLTPAGSRFNIKRLRDQLGIIRKGGGFPIQIGELEWDRDSKGEVVGVNWEANPLGRFRIVEHPMIHSVSNKPYSNLYVGGTDSYDRNKTASKDGSFGATYIFKRYLNAESTSNLFVAGLFERPETSAEFYEDTAKLSVYYSAPNLVEYSNLLILEWYRQNGFEYLLKERPEVAYATMIKSGMDNKYGIDPATKPYWIQSLADYINTNTHSIWDEDLLTALINYREDDKDFNCDRTIAASLCVTHNNDILHRDVMEDTVTFGHGKRHKYVRINGRLTKVYA